MSKRISEKARLAQQIAIFIIERDQLKEHARKSLLKLKLALDTLRQIERTRSPRCKRLATSAIMFIESLK